MPQVVPEVETFARIRVVGVGGAGNAAVDRMITEDVKGIDFIAVNTDAQALHNSDAGTKIHIGQQTTRGLGAGADPSVGKTAAEESLDELKEALEGADMVFITYGAGGGTGSGAGPMIAQLAKDQGILTVGIATKPFAFEGERRRRNAEESISSLRKSVDTLITIPNDKLLQTTERNLPLIEAFKVADDVLRQGVQGISDLITVHGMINLDFADVKAVMNNAGSALMGIGSATGENRAVEAAQNAIESPLLEVSIDGARGVLFNVTGGNDMSMHEINEAAETITSAVDSDANIIFGATLDQDMKDEIKITVIATGFDAAYFVEARREADRDGLAYFSKPDRAETSSSIGSSSDDFDDDLPDDMDVDLDSTDIDSAGDSLKEIDQQTENIREASESSIWSVDDDDDDDDSSLDQPAFLRRRKKNKKKQADE